MCVADRDQAELQQPRLTARPPPCWTDGQRGGVSLGFYYPLMSVHRKAALMLWWFHTLSTREQACHTLTRSEVTQADRVRVSSEAS